MSLWSAPIQQALSKIQSPCTLQLRQLFVSSLDKVPEHVSLPEVQALHVLLSVDNRQLLPGRFPKLTVLNWARPSVEQLMPVLEQVGHQLQTLHFDVCRGQLWLDRVLDACPNLSDLSYDTWDSLQSSVALQPDTLSRLQTLRLEFYRSSYLEAGLLLQILRLAPQLRSVQLKSVMLPDQDLREWAELAKEGTCMQRLQQIELALHPDYCTEHKHLLDEALISCSIHCPQLKHVSLDTFKSRLG
jgi:hypothetical protein